MTMGIQPIQPNEPRFQDALLALWNAACDPEWAITPAFIRFNLHAATDVTRAAWVAVEHEQPVGFVLANTWSGNPALGWVEAIAVTPSWQNRGVGAALLEQAETWLRECGCVRVRLGGGLRPFAPGLPVDGVLVPVQPPSSTANDQSATVGTWFHKRGYLGDRIEIDLARDLADYQTPAGVVPTDNMRPLDTSETEALLEFFGRAFPGRWEYEAQEHLHAGGSPGDFLALWQHGRVEGFCYITTKGSFRPLDRFYMHKLPQPWGQLGPLGLSRETRGQGYGVAIIDAALRHLQATGVRGCVIDWTTFVELYGKFGFLPYHRYVVLIKELTT